MIRRACCRTEALHLGHEERNEGPRVLDTCLGLLIEIALVGRSAALGHHEETIFVSLDSLDVDLGRKIALGVDLIVHVKRSVLRVAEILFCISLEYSEREGLFILEAGPDLLAFLAVDDSGTCILAEREFALCSHFRIAEEGQGDIFVIGSRLRIRKDLRNLLVVATAEKEADIPERCVSHEGEGLRCNLENLLALEF